MLCAVDEITRLDEGCDQNGLWILLMVLYLYVCGLLTIFVVKISILLVFVVGKKPLSQSLFKTNNETSSRIPGLLRPNLVPNIETVSFAQSARLKRRCLSQSSHMDSYLVSYDRPKGLTSLYWTCKT